MDPTKKYLCLNILGFKRNGITPEEFQDYMLNVHAPHVGGLLAQYGIVHWSMVRKPVFPNCALASRSSY
jgi:hypothetical protein